MAEQAPAQMLGRSEQLLIRGDLIAAEKNAKEGLRQYAGTPKWEEEFRFELAKVFLYEGESTRTAELLREPLLRTAPNTRLNGYLILAIAELRRGNLDLACQALNQANALGPTGALRGEMLAVKGSIALAHERLDEAKLFLEAALQEDLATDSKFSATQVLMNLGVVYLSEQHYTDALFMFQRASSIAEILEARQLIEKAKGNIGRVYYQSGDFRRARQNSQAATMEALALGAKRDQIHWIMNTGLSAFAEGDVKEAQSSFERASELAAQTKSPDLMLQGEVAISYLLIRTHPDLAQSHIDEAKRLAVNGPNRSDDLEPLLLESLLAVQQRRFAEAEMMLRALVDQSTDAPSLQWEAAKTLADLYDQTKRFQPAQLWYAHAINTFHRQRLTIKSVELQLPFLENGSDLYMGYMEHLIRAGRTGEALRLLDMSRAETLAEGLGTAPAQAGKAADPRVVAGRLRATILVYCLRPERSYLWAITGKRQAFYMLPGSGAILPLVARHNEAILGSKDLTTQKDSTGRALYDALVAPAAGLLPKDGGRVVLVADSALSRLNFETLIAPGGPAQGKAAHYWIEDVSVTNARSLRLLAAGGEARRTEKAGSDAPKMLLIGDPVYAKGEYASLPNAGAEMAGIAGHFSPAERVVAARQEALPAVYEASRPGRFRFLHFVAHATASELNPLDSAVILSNKDTGKDTGAASGANKLYASEILKQPLSAELVTLSSCYSSGTRNYTGEGVVGLAWAFLRAGAHSVIGALWQVSDVSTPKLMDTMYTRLLAGDAPDAALRAAKLEMLHSEGVFRKPVYWGAFQLYAGR